MANIEDYLPGGKNDPDAQADGITQEIDDATKTEVARQDASTPSHDWEDRFKELEKHNSVQAQTLGDYRKIIDDYIVDPTPAASEPVIEESSVNYDDLYNNPSDVIQGAINDALRNHPAIQLAEANEKRRALDAQKEEIATFRTAHPDYLDISSDPEFKSWVHETKTRTVLAQQADSYDMNSADALFSLYKAEKGLTKVVTDQQETAAIQAASLEDSSQQLVETPHKYSRSEFVNNKTRAEQGDPDMERWINANIAAYREALQSGNVRD